jgi:hypothetical protein
VTPKRTHKKTYQGFLKLFGWFVGVAFMMVVTAPPGVTETPLRLNYTGYFGGLEAVEVDISIALEKDKYDITSVTRSTGFLDYLSSFRSQVRGLGAWPFGPDQRFWLVGEYSGKKRQIELQRLPSASFHVAITPPIPIDERDPVPPQLQKNSFDPIAAYVKIAMQPSAANMCAGMVPIYNGTIRSDIEIRHIGREQLQPSPYSSFEGQAERCRLTYTVRAGAYKKSWLGRSDSAPVIDVWVARRDDVALWLPVRVRSETDLATVFLHLTSPTFESEG